MEHNLCTIANQIAHSDSLSALLRLRLHQFISAPSEVLGLSGGGLRVHNCRPSSKDSSETQCLNLHNSTRHQAIIYIYLLYDRFSIVFHHRSYGPTGAPMTDALIFFPRVHFVGAICLLSQRIEAPPVWRMMRIGTEQLSPKPMDSQAF